MPGTLYRKKSGIKLFGEPAEADEAADAKKPSKRKTAKKKSATKKAAKKK